MNYDFTIIIPVFNELGNLKKLEEVLVEYFKISSLKTCAVFVDDGSTDGGTEIIKEITTRNKDLFHIIFTQNCGKGAALKAGFDVVESPFVGYMDADLQTLPADFELLLPFMKDFALVTGWRKKRKDALGKKISSKIGNAVRALFVHDKIHDSGCPLKVMHTNYAKAIPMFTGLQRLIPAMIILQNGKVKEVPIPHYPRFSGVSKYSFKNRFLGPLFDVFGYLWMKKTYINFHIREKKLF